MGSPRYNERLYRRGWQIHCKLGTGPSGHLRVRGRRRVLRVGDEIEALSVPFVHGEQWTRWRVREVDITQVPTWYVVAKP